MEQATQNAEERYCFGEGGAVLPEVSPEEVRRLAVEYQIIDFHAHIYPDKIAEKAAESVGAFYDIPVQRTGTVDSLLKSGMEAGVQRFVVQSVATSAGQVGSINRFIAQICVQHPTQLIGLGTLHPGVEEPGRDIEEILSLGLHGVKLHPDFQRFYIDDPLMFPIYEMLEGRLPILMHTGDFRFDYSHPRRLAAVLKRFPRLQVVAAHFGGWSVWEDAVKYLADSGCYIDTSSSLPFFSKKKALEYIRAFGDDRVLFGTDYPMWGHREELQRFFSLELTDKQRLKFCSENASGLLRI